MAYTFNANYLKAQSNLTQPYYCPKPLRAQNNLYSLGQVSCGLNEIYFNRFRGSDHDNKFYLKPVFFLDYSRPGVRGIHAPILERNDSMFMHFFPYNANWAEFKNNHLLYNASNSRLGIDQYDGMHWPNTTQTDNGLYNGIYEVTSADPTDPNCPDREPFYFMFYAGPEKFLFEDGPDMDFYGGGSGDYVATYQNNSNAYLPEGDIGYKCHEFGGYGKVGYDYLDFSTKNLPVLKQFWDKKRIGIRISGASNGVAKEAITLVDFDVSCSSGGVIIPIGPTPIEDEDEILTESLSSSSSPVAALPEVQSNSAKTQSLLACNCPTQLTPQANDMVVIFKPIVYLSRNIFVVEKFENQVYPEFDMDLTNTTGCQNVYIFVSATYNGIVETKTVCLSALKFDIKKIQLFFHKLPDTYEIKFVKQDINCIIGGNNGN